MNHKAFYHRSAWFWLRAACVLLSTSSPTVEASSEPLDVLALSNALNATGRPLRWKVLSEILCSSDIPDPIAQVVLTNLVLGLKPTLDSQLSQATAARCAESSSIQQLVQLNEAMRPRPLTLCCFLARLSNRKAEVQPLLLDLTESTSPETATAARIARAALTRDSTGLESHLRQALREGGERKKRVIWCLEMCGSSDWISVDIAKDIARLASEDGDELIPVGAILGAMGPRASPVAGLLEEAWQKDSAITGPIANRDLVLRTALARIRGQWDEKAARAVLKDAGDYEVFDVTTIATLDLVCYRILGHADLDPIFRLIDEKDQRTLRGAVRFCSILGARARPAESALLRALEVNKDEAVRTDIIGAIAMVANRHTRSTMRELAATSPSQEERQTFAEWDRVITATATALGPLFP